MDVTFSTPVKLNTTTAVVSATWRVDAGVTGVNSHYFEWSDDDVAWHSAETSDIVVSSVPGTSVLQVAGEAILPVGRSFFVRVNAANAAGAIGSASVKVATVGELL